MPKRTSDHGKHNRTPLLGGLKDSMNALAADLGLSKPKKHDTNPFGDALRETSERKGGIIDELTRHAVALSPVIKRRTFPELEWQRRCILRNAASTSVEKTCSRLPNPPASTQNSLPVS